MLDITELFDTIENLFDAGESLESLSADQLAEALSYTDIDPSELSAEQINDMVSTAGKQATFGSSSPMYYEGMHGRIDASYDGGSTWETIN